MRGEVLKSKTGWNGPKLLAGAKELVRIIRTNCNLNIREGQIRSSVGTEVVIRLVLIGKVVKMRYYVNNSVQKFDINQKTASGGNLVKIVHDIICEHCARKGIAIVTGNSSDDLYSETQELEVNSLEIGQQPLDVGEDSELADLRQQLETAQQELADERKKSSQRDSLQREMDGIVQKLHADFEKPVQVERVSEVSLIKEFDRRLKQELERARAALRSEVTSGLKLKQQLGCHKQEEESLESQIEILHANLTMLFERVCEGAQKKVFERTEAAYCELEVAIAQQAQNKQQLDQVKANLLSATSLLEQAGISLSRRCLMLAIVTTYHSSVLLVQSIVQATLEKGEGDIWKAFEADAAAGTCKVPLDPFFTKMMEKVGMTESEVADWLERQIREKGLDALASGPDQSRDRPLSKLGRKLLRRK